MRFARRHASALGLVLAVSVGFWGCAHHQARAPQGISDEIRAELNTVGVPRASFSPEVRLTTSGQGMGALKGAGSGLVAGVSPGLSFTGGVIEACGGARGFGALICVAAAGVGLGVAAAGGMFGALGGTVYGAVTADSASRISAAKTELAGAVVDLNVQQTLRDHVLRAVRERTDLTFVTLDDGGPTVPGESLSYQGLQSEGIDTVLEVSVARIGLAGKGGITPPVALTMTARARMIRASDGVEIFGETFEHAFGPEYKFILWAEEEGRAFREEVGRGLERLADDIARLLFPSAPVRERALSEEPPEIPPSPLSNDAAVPRKSSMSSGAGIATNRPAVLDSQVAVVVGAISPSPLSHDAEVASSVPGGAVTAANRPTVLDSHAAAVVGRWLGTFRPIEGTHTYPVTLRIFEGDGQLRWTLVRAAGVTRSDAGTVLVSEADVTLIGTSTYSLKRIGESLIGSGVGTDHRPETVLLLRGNAR